MVPTARKTGKKIAIRPQCPTHELIRLIGDRWSVLVLITLNDYGESRASDLLRGVDGISQKMLTHTLRSLERNGLVARCVEATVPISVSYQLTPLGMSLCRVLGSIRTWADAHIDDIRTARHRTAGRSA